MKPLYAVAAVTASIAIVGATAPSLAQASEHSPDVRHVETLKKLPFTPDQLGVKASTLPDALRMSPANVQAGGSWSPLAQNRQFFSRIYQYNLVNWGLNYAAPASVPGNAKIPTVTWNFGVTPPNQYDYGGTLVVALCS